MSKLAVEINTGIRKLLKRGRRGIMHVETNRNGDVTSTEWKRSCYCLSRGLVPDMTICPEHRKPIVHGEHRTMLEHLIDG